MQTNESELTKILGVLAVEVINYDKRMTDMGSPPVRFVNKYTAKAEKAIKALLATEYARGEAAGRAQLLKALDLNDLRAQGDGFLSPIADRIEKIAAALDAGEEEPQNDQ